MCYYKTCPVCGGNLDPGEKCDCQEKVKEMTADAVTPTAKAKTNYTTRLSQDGGKIKNDHNFYS